MNEKSLEIRKEILVLVKHIQLEITRMSMSIVQDNEITNPEDKDNEELILLQTC